MHLFKRLSPFYEEDGGGTGAVVPESVPSEPAADNSDLMDEGDWGEAQKEADIENSKTESQPEPTVETKPEPKAETIPQTVKIKYNKQEVELTQEQLLEAAQRGLDYERVRESRDRFMAPIERLAQQSGMATDQFLIALDGMIKANAVEVKKQEFINLGVDEALANQMAEMAYENEMLKSGQAAQTQQQNERAKAQQALNDKIQSDIADFESRFPGVNELPDEVVKAIKGGEAPLVAYQSYLIRENEKKLKAFEQNQKNKETTAGPAKTMGQDKADPFLEGFMGG
jgi:hypothetical protein